MSFEEILEKLSNEDVLVKKTTLISITVAIFVVSLSIESYIKDILPLWYIRFFIYIILILIWWIFWYYKRNELPETPEGKIGVVMAITTKDEKCRTRFEDDFVAEFKRHIKESGLNDLIYVVQTKNYQADRLKPILEEQESATEIYEKWTSIQKKIKGHLYIWGTLKERNQEKNNFILDYNVYVEHDKFEERIKNELNTDIKQFWLQRFRIEETNEIEGFLDSATQYYLVAKYLIGYAALYSGASDAAFVLHQSLENDLLGKNIPNGPELLDKTRKHLSTENFVFAYLATKQGKNIREIEHYLKKCLEYNAENGNAYIFKARLEFTHKGNPNSALQYVYHAKKYSPFDDGTWRYSEAFLKMYLDEHENALKIYEAIFNHSFDFEEDILNQVVEFNLQQIQKRPPFLESYFILVILNYKKIHNLPVALDYFDKFLNRIGKLKKYRYLKTAAKNYKREIESQMQLKIL